MDADSVWLLMGREYRISRSIRVQWFFEHLNKVVKPKPNEDIINSWEELEVISVVPIHADDITEDTRQKLQIVPTTKLSFVGRQYRFVFCLDMTPSIATIDSESGNVLMDDMFSNIKNCLSGLVKPFCIPGSSLILKPRLHVTVLAHTYINVKECKVLVQGYCVNEENVKYFLCQLKRKLQVLEKTVAEDVSQKKMNAENEGEHSEYKRSLFYMIRDGLFALQLLPENASASIVVVTDGVFILENALIADALLAQVRHSTAVCSFLQVGTGYKRASVEFGYVPHCALMQFIAAATSGAYLATCPEENGGEGYEMNLYHKALFCWNFQRDIDRDKIDTYQDIRSNTSSLILPSLKDTLAKDTSKTLPAQPQQTMKYMEFALQTKISSLLTVRSREGYITDSIQIIDVVGQTPQIEVKLVWPWKEHVTIEYIAKAPWPFESSSYSTHVVVKVSGPYDFLVDITSTKPKNHRALRNFVLQRFDFTMKSLEYSDQLLVQLQLFPVHQYASQIPDVISKGSPLFFVPHNATKPALTLQYGTKTKKSSKSPEAQFANYWKPVVDMDTKSWTKWLHCHRISVLLEHDKPINTGLFLPSSTGHYPQIYCRNSHNAFLRVIREWCTFTLLENHSYIKFINMHGETSGTPETFCLLRLTFKGLCVVVRLAFLGGTPGNIRSQVVKVLREQLLALKSPNARVERRKALNKKEDNQPCLIFLTKQFERIFVKYDYIPEEILKGTPPAVVSETALAVNPMESSILSQYLFN